MFLYHDYALEEAMGSSACHDTYESDDNYTIPMTELMKNIDWSLLKLQQAVFIFTGSFGKYPQKSFLCRNFQTLPGVLHILRKVLCWHLVVSVNSKGETIHSFF